MIDKEKVLIAIEQLLNYAKSNLELESSDTEYVRNLLLANFNLPCPLSGDVDKCENIQDAIDVMIDYAFENSLSDSEDRILYETKILGLVTPMPSQVIRMFNKLKKAEGIQAATSWLFKLCKANNYIRMIDINKNIMWNYKGSHGDLVVTINLSKPEKDPKQILAALKAKTGYPECMLCKTNVGFKGNAGHPARQTLRIIPITLNDEDWAIQYSPYQYYGEHLIALCCEHRPMDVNKSCLQRLADFVEQFPHYFMGSNAALPIVGGSILTHDHYQGGGKGLPMFGAPVRTKYKTDYKGVDVMRVDWYNSVIRVMGKKKANVVNAAADIMDKWKNYSDESVNIICKTDAQHNAVTPIARVEDSKFVIDMILRNNRTDEAHPYGIYHPTEDLHNIKKEGIGIIEVMGTFILPGRLEKELKAIAEYLTGNVPYDATELAKEDNALNKHKDMIASLVEQFGTHNNAELANNIVRGYINNACERILECTAVFKNTDEGDKAFERFMKDCLNCR